MDIYPTGTISTRRAPADYFTGTVWQIPIVAAPEPARLRSTHVTFEPGARTHWHTHPLGQTLYVVSGIGRIQSWGGKVRDIHAGDIVWIPPGEKHWHGAAPDSLMTHIAMQEELDGRFADWLEPVSEEQYAASIAR